MSSRARLFELIVTHLFACLVPLCACARMALPRVAHTVKTFAVNVDVGADDHPHDGAVVLLERVVNTVDRNGSLLENEYYRLIKLLRDESRIGPVRIAVPLTAEIEYAARTVAPDGQLHWVAQSDFHSEVIDAGDPFQPAVKFITFAFPAIQKGALVEYAYKIRNRSQLPADIHVFGGTLPIRRALYELRYSPNRKFDVHAHSPDPARQITVGRGSTSTTAGEPLVVETYQVQNLAARPDEPYALRELNEIPHVKVLDTFFTRSWDRIATQIHGIRESRGGHVIDDEPRQRAMKIARRYESHYDRMNAILKPLVGNLRMESRVPLLGRSLHQVIESGVAQPFELALLITVMFEAAGLDSRLAIANSAGSWELDERVPWSGFLDRWVVVTRVDGKTYVFDPDSPHLLRGLPRADCQGRTALLAYPAGDGREVKARLIHLPSSSAADNAVERTVEVKVDSTGAADVNLSESRSGEAAWQLYDLVQSIGQDAAARHLARQLLANIPDTEANHVDLHVGPSRANIRVQFRTVSLVASGDETSVIATDALTRWSLLDVLGLKPLGDRAHGVDLHYPRQFSTTVEVELPAGIAVRTVPPRIAHSGASTETTMTTSQNGHGFRQTVVAKLERPRWPRSELAPLTELLRTVQRAQAQVVELSGPLVAAQQP